jgi:hypothetical protein
MYATARPLKSRQLGHHPCDDRASMHSTHAKCLKLLEHDQSFRHPPQQATPGQQDASGAPHRAHPAEECPQGHVVRHERTELALPSPITVHQFFDGDVLGDELEQNISVDWNERALVEPNQTIILVEQVTSDCATTSANVFISSSRAQGRNGKMECRDQGGG